MITDGLWRHYLEAAKHFALSSLCFVLPPVAGIQAIYADESDNKGLKIAREVDRRANDGYGDLTVSATMILRDARGKESRRQLRISNLEMPDDGDKSLVVFDEPKDVKGTALLTFSHKFEDDDQWLYLPALARVKRISSSNKSGPFMGSEFAFEDFSSREVEKFTYKFLREDTLGDAKVYVYERYPVDRNSGYSKQIVYVDQDEYRLRRVDFFDRKGDHLKTFTAGEFRRYLNHYWRPHKMIMVNHQTGKSTDLLWGNYRFQTGLSENDFTKASLRRAR